MMVLRLEFGLAVIAAGAVLLGGCTVVGSGKSTLVLAPRPNPSTYPGEEFNHLIGGSRAEPRLIGMGGNPPASAADWAVFQTNRLVRSAGTAAQVGVNVRDQTNTPPLDLFNVEMVTAADTAKILTDKSLSIEQKDALLTQLRDNYRAMPESYSRLVGHGVDKATGGLVYYYFPQVTVDLTGTLNTAETLDRFDFLAAAIRIPAGVNARFINFSPKAADLFDFTLGQMKQTASLTASATAANKATVGTSQTDTTRKSSDTDTTGAELGYGGSLSFTMGDEFTRDLKSSLEARSAGIFNGGKLFLVELRSNDQKRIAGTYTFNVMLEVPATSTQLVNGAVTTWMSKPAVEEVVAEVRVVGIVRHVVKPGKTGTFKRVPETLNDTTFRQVFLSDEKASLWRYGNVPTARIFTAYNLTVRSNVDGAGFTVYDEVTGKAVGHGSGRTVQLAVPDGHRVRVEFQPVIMGGDKPVALRAATVSGISVAGGASVNGNYVP